MAKRNFTQAERDAADRLQAIWNRKKKALGLTQEQAARACGWTTQAAFSQYLLGKIPLNTDAVISIAKVLQVAPQEIMPAIAERLPVSTGSSASESALHLAQAVDALPESEQATVRALVDSLSRASPLISEEALQLAQQIEALSSKKRAALKALLAAEDSLGG